MSSIFLCLFITVLGTVFCLPAHSLLCGSPIINSSVRPPLRQSIVHFASMHKTTIELLNGILCAI